MEFCVKLRSLPLWERGLKSLCRVFGMLSPVAPLVGAWIEILRLLFYQAVVLVAPLVGAWIEITTVSDSSCFPLVAPLVGAWIEMGHAVCDRGDHWALPLWERGLKWS